MSFVDNSHKGGVTPVQRVNLDYPIRQIRGTSVSGTTGPVIPKHVTNVRVSSSTNSDKQTTLVTVSFQRDPSDNHFDHVRVLARGLNGSNTHTMLALGKDSPLTFTLPNTAQPAGIVVQAVGNHGAAPLATAPSSNMKLASGNFGGSGSYARQTASNLGQLPDSNARRAVTTGTLSYRPTTNPLTATDAGSNVTVNVASSTMRTVVKDSAINSGTLTGLSYGTVYYVYYDDANLTGGAVTYVATTTKATALNGPSRVFVGSILTPIATGADTIGNNDGGTGAQSGGIGTFRPTANTGAGILNPTFAYDGDTTTFAAASDSSIAMSPEVMLISGIPVPTGFGSNALSSATLYVKAQCTKANGAGASTEGKLEYSINGGSSWTTIFDVTGTTTQATTTFSFALPNNQLLSSVQVRGSATYIGGAALTSVSVRVYEVWVVGVA